MARIEINAESYAEKFVAVGQKYGFPVINYSTEAIMHAKNTDGHDVR